MSINDEYIKQKFFTYSNKINRHAVKRVSKTELEYLLNRYNDSDSINETLLRIRDNIAFHPHCKTCGKRLDFKFINGHLKEYCSSKCANNNEIVKEKRKNTCLERYGVNNAGGSKQSLEKIKQTCLEKYGCEYTGQAEIKKLNCKKTFLKHYGVDHNWKNENVIKQCILNRFKNKIEINNISSSKEEQQCFDILSKKFKTIIRQHLDEEKYPFYCDFYIKDIDTWIEYNGFMTHGGHPFNATDENDINKLNYLKHLDMVHKTPGNNLYNSTIYNWTIEDPIKRKTAMKNNLKYLEFFNAEELQNWVNNYNYKYNE